MEQIMIKHQTQPTNWSCCHTCIAMVLGEPAQKVIEALGIERGLSEKEFQFALQKFNIAHNLFVYGEILYTGYYFMTVPSLNNDGGHHKILVHYNNKTSRFRVFDPSPKKTYAKNGYNLKSWADLTGILISGKI